MIGREQAYGVTPRGGQCADNTVGVWWSLPKEGECDGDHVVGDDSGCTWKLLGQIKTVLVSCVLSNGFIDACNKDNFELPYTNAANVLKQAFASDDPSDGGCPDVQTVSTLSASPRNVMKSAADVMNTVCSEHSLASCTVAPLFGRYLGA